MQLTNVNRPHGQFRPTSIPPHDVANIPTTIIGFWWISTAEIFLGIATRKQNWRRNSSRASVMSAWFSTDYGKLTKTGWSNKKDADGRMSRMWGMWPNMMVTDIRLMLLIIMIGHSLCLPSSLWSVSSPSLVSNAACFSSVSCDLNPSALKLGGLPAMMAYPSVLPMQSR